MLFWLLCAMYLGLAGVGFEVGLEVARGTCSRRQHRVDRLCYLFVGRHRLGDSNRHHGFECGGVWSIGGNGPGVREFLDEGGMFSASTV